MKILFREREIKTNSNNYCMQYLLVQGVFSNIESHAYLKENIDFMASFQIVYDSLQSTQHTAHN